MSEPIQNALRRLRDDSAGKKPPESIEATLLAAYRAHHAPRKRRWMWIPAAVAASVAAAMLWSPSSPTPIVRAPVRAPAALPASPEIVPAKETPKPKPRVRRPPIRPLAKSPQQRPQEFYEIPYTPALADYDSGSVVRVNMPGASVRSLGLPVMSDRVQADLFVGDDGVARAIRVVSSPGLNSRR